jgi:hypothetical protein
MTRERHDLSEARGSLAIRIVDRDNLGIRGDPGKDRHIMDPNFR